MDSRHGKMRMNVEGDRLSSLPDDLIYKILSFINIRDAIGTSVLSSRWRFIWTSLPYLNLSIEDFSTLPQFSKFVTNVLYRRNFRAEVYSLKLRLRVKASLLTVKRILNFALTQNIQQLNVTCLLEKNIEFPLSIFSSRSLKHLSLTMQDGISCRYRLNSCCTSTWDLPKLTTLDLQSVTLHDDDADKYINVFYKCQNLKNLTLKHFSTIGSKGFSIFHPCLSNLTLEYKCCKNVVNVVAPQLKNLTIRFCSGEHVISAPELASLFYEGTHPLHLSTEGFISLEKADICVSSPQDANAHQIVCLLQQLHNVKFLKLNMEIVEILSSSVDLILHQPSPFVNLKTLKIYPHRKVIYGKQAAKKVTIMSTELKSYLLDSSLGCTFTMVLREEIQAQRLMAELRVLLNRKNDKSKTNRPHLDRGKPHELKKFKFGEIMVQMKSCWEDLVVQLHQRKETACFIISKLQDIEQLLTKLPASNRAKIQPSFSSLCAEAHIALSKLTDMNIHCDEFQSRLSVWFQNELATALEPSS